MKHLFKTACVAAALVATVFTASAIPARKGVREWRQADGTVLRLQVVGDEHFNYYLSEDDYLLVDCDGNFYFAELNAEGTALEPSQYRATNAADRDAACSAFLSTLSREDMMQVMTMEALEAHANEALHRAGPGLFSSASFPSTGEQKVLVILVDFADLPFTVENPADYFYRMLNEDDFSDYHATGSSRQYFIESSVGQFVPEFDVYGPVTMPNGYAYYGQDTSSSNRDINIRELVITAVQALDDQIDYAQYDRNNDGVIDNVYIFYAGEGQATSTDTNTIWPHSSTITNGGYYDGKRLSKYGCSNEWQSDRSGGIPDGPGTMCHEFSHILGLPDTYSTTYNDCFTPGAWDIMDQGAYNNFGFSPPLYTAQERWALGWLEPEEINGPMNCQLPALATSNKAYIIRTYRFNEYFLLENRQQMSWDTYAPGHGMLIWHIDFNQSLWDRNSVNNNPDHQYVDLVEADNLMTEASRTGDAFPGSSGVTSFTSATTPSLTTWSGAAIDLPITEITENAPDGLISFKVSGGGNPCASTTALAATDVTPRSFTARWAASADAQSYLLTVYTKDADNNPVYLPAYDSRRVAAGTTQMSVIGLDPSTPYFYNVVVESGIAMSFASNEIAVNTLALTDDYILPVALDAADVADNSFTARWEPVDGASDYILNVSCRRLEGTTTEYEHFDNRTISWFSSSSTFFTNSQYIGESKPSLRLNNGQYISCHYVSQPIHSLKFWYRGKSTNADSRVVVEYITNGSWVPVASSPVVTDLGGATVTIGNIPAEAEAVRVVLVDPAGRGMIYIDDLEVIHGGKAIVTPVEGFTDCHTGNVTSLSVAPVNSGTEHFYTVRAVKGGTESLTSAPIYVVTTGVSSLGSIAADADSRVAVEGSNIVINAKAGASIVVADLNGRILFSGRSAQGALSVAATPGAAYIVAIDGAAVKVVVK